MDTYSITPWRVVHVIHNVDHYSAPTPRYYKSRKKVTAGRNHGDKTPHPLPRALSQNNCLGGISSFYNSIGAVHFHFEVTDGVHSPNR